jgi:hypothetical protein
MTIPNELPANLFAPGALDEFSRKYLLIAAFLRSRSEAFPLAIQAARAADLFFERDLETMRVFVAGFLPSQQGATQAIDLVHYIRGWTGTHFYANGRMIIGSLENAYYLESILECFIESCLSDDYRAHCHRTIDTPYFPIVQLIKLERIHPAFRHITAQSDEGIYTFPCKHMLQWFQAQEHHSSSVRDQIQAEGVEKYCDLCPRFNPDDFKKREEE